MAFAAVCKFLPSMQRCCSVETSNVMRCYSFLLILKSNYSISKGISNKRVAFFQRPTCTNKNTRIVTKLSSSKLSTFFGHPDYMTIAQVVELLRHERSKDICVINVPPEYGYVEYLIVCSGLSTRHIKGMAKALASQFRGKHLPGIGKVKIEGSDSDDWIVVDIGNMVVHFFLPQTRKKYELEKLWLLGSKYDDQLKTMLMEEDSSTVKT